MLWDLTLVALLPLVVWLVSMSYVQWRSKTLSTPAYPPASTDPPYRIRELQGISIFAFAVLLTAESAHLSGMQVATKWLIPAWLFFSWFLCAAIPRKLNVQRLLLPTGVAICIYWVGLFVYVGQVNPSFDLFRDATNQRHAIADEVTEVFHQHFNQRLQFVAGDEALIFSAAF
jgi:hypothetical protein